MTVDEIGVDKLGINQTQCAHNEQMNHIYLWDI